MAMTNDVPAGSSKPAHVSIDQKLRELSHFVTAKVAGLDKGLEKGDTQTRARLARLRRSGAGDDRSWMLVGDDLFDSSLGGVAWNVDVLGKPERYPERPNPYFNAALVALQFYALHRQSHSSDVNTTDTHASFGWACSWIGKPSMHHSGVGKKDIDEQQQEQQTGDAGPQAGVRRRLYAMERAVDFPSLLVYMRGLVSMLETKDGHPIPLNYSVLVKDLYRLQSPDWREGVFRRWSQDFYSPHKSGDQKEDTDQ